jgi:hypothetical protein
MCVDMRARRNPAVGEANNLAVSPDWSSVGDLSNRDFVAGPDVFRRTDVDRTVDEMVAGFKRAFQDRDIVIVAKQHCDFCKISFGH